MTPEEKAAFCRRMGIPVVREEKPPRELPTKFCQRKGCVNPLLVMSVPFFGSHLFCSPTCKRRHDKDKARPGR